MRLSGIRYTLPGLHGLEALECRVVHRAGKKGIRSLCIAVYPGGQHEDVGIDADDELARHRHGAVLIGPQAGNRVDKPRATHDLVP